MLPVAHAAERLNLSGLAGGDLHSRFIVKYKDGSAERSNPTAAANALRTVGAGIAGQRGKAVGVRHLRRMAVGADVVTSDSQLDRASAEALMRQIAANPNVEYVEVDKINRALYTPNDPNFSQQWGYGTGAGGIRATEAWDKATGQGAVVAVLDTGITNHSDLNANILPGYDFISAYTLPGGTTIGNDGDGRDSNPADPGDYLTTGECGTDSFGRPVPGSPTGSSWHGTHVAGTVAAVTNNGKGVAGTAFNAKVVPVRVLGKCGGFDSDIADAIIWASGGTVSGVPANANPAEVINLSLGGSGSCNATTQAAINGAVSRGTTVVIAAGNDNGNVSNASPANCNNVVAVASNTSTGARSSFSNYGALIDVSAPGSNILSTLNNGSTSPGTEGYASYNGTSMATPHVAGVVALIQSASSTPKTPAEIEALLKSTASPFPSTPSQPIGAGIVNAKAAVDAVSGGGGGTPTPTPGTQTYTNGTDVAIRDFSTVTSSISVSGRTGNAPSSSTVAVNIVHTYIGDLKVDLVAPDGSVYVLHNRTGSSTDNINKTYTVNLSSEALNGTWRLRVNDGAGGDIGRIDTWSITF